jgi:hypothetical protein
MIIRVIFIFLCLNCISPVFSQQSKEQIKREKKDEKAKEKAQRDYESYRAKTLKHKYDIQSKLTKKQIKEFQKESEKFNNSGKKSKNKRRFWLFSRNRN